MPLLMMPQEKRKHSREKERNRIQNCKRKRRFQHRADFVRVLAQRVIHALAPKAEWSEGLEEPAAGEVAAVFGRDASELVDTGDEGA